MRAVDRTPVPVDERAAVPTARPARSAVSALPAWRRWATAFYLTIRVSALGFTLVLPLVGAVSRGGAIGAWQMAVLMLVALSFHVFAYVLNDVVDLRLDRSEPLRADSPLVQGTFGRNQSLALAWVQLPVAFGLAYVAAASAAALGMLLVAFAAMAAYNLYGKRCRWPVFTDAVQAIGWCALLGMGAAWHGPPGNAPVGYGPVWPTFAGWIAAFVFFCVMLVQGVHGGLRDLANDQRGGARTTALWLGARPGSGTGIVISGAMAGYAVLLQAALWLTAMAAASAPPNMAASASMRLLVIALLVAASGALVLAYRRRSERRRLIAAGALNIVCTLLVLPVLVLPSLDLAEASALLAALLLPIAAMLAYNGSHWRLSPQSQPKAAP